MLAEFLRGLEAEELSPAVLLIVGRVFPEAEKSTLDVGWATISKVLKKGRQVTLIDRPLGIIEVNSHFRDIASARGRGSRRRKEQLIESLLGRAGELERKYILKNFSGEMWIGVSEGVMLEGIAKAG